MPGPPNREAPPAPPGGACAVARQLMVQAAGICAGMNITLAGPVTGRPCDWPAMPGNHGHWQILQQPRYGRRRAACRRAVALLVFRQTARPRSDMLTGRPGRNRVGEGSVWRCGCTGPPGELMLRLSPQVGAATCAAVWGRRAAGKRGTPAARPGCCQMASTRRRRSLMAPALTGAGHRPSRTCRSTGRRACRAAAPPREIRKLTGGRRRALKLRIRSNTSFLFVAPGGSVSRPPWGPSCERPHLRPRTWLQDVGNTV